MRELKPIPKKGLAEYAIGLFTFAILIGAGAIVINWAATHTLFVPPSVSEVREIRISAYMWEFYPPKINVKQGEKVSIVMTSLDTIHGLMVNLPNGEMVHGDLKPGEEFRFEFMAEMEGAYFFHCNRYCGIGHTDMRGLIIVE